METILNHQNNILFDLDKLTALQISGPDAKKFLQGQLTCNLDELNDNASLAAHCNREGRIVSLFTILLFNDVYYLILPKNMAEIAFAALKKYAVFYKATMKLLDDHMHIYGYQGQQVNNPVLRFFNFETTSSRFILLTQLTKDEILEKTAASNFLNTKAWHYINLTQGIASIYPETSGIFLPHDINLPNLGGVSFNKGCYTGQEIIARMHYRGKLKNQLQKARINSNDTPKRNESVYFQSETALRIVGTIVDVEEEAYNQYISLILIDINYTDTKIRLKNEKSAIQILK